MKCPVCNNELNFILPEIDGTKAFICNKCGLSGMVRKWLNNKEAIFCTISGKIMILDVEEENGNNR